LAAGSDDRTGQRQPQRPTQPPWTGTPPLKTHLEQQVQLRHLEHLPVRPQVARHHARLHGGPPHAQLLRRHRLLVLVLLLGSGGRCGGAARRRPCACGCGAGSVCIRTTCSCSGRAPGCRRRCSTRPARPGIPALLSPPRRSRRLLVPHARLLPLLPHLHDPLLDRPLDEELLHHDRPLLPHPPRAPDRLLLQRGVDAGLQQEDVVGCGQVDAHSAAADAEQEDSGGGVLLEGLGGV